MALSKEDSLKMVEITKKALEDRKAIDLKVIDISEVSTIADYFVIASGSNSSQIDALVDNVEREMTLKGYEPNHIEGKGGENWILLDYGDVIVHVFDIQSREYYDIERMWRDGIEIVSEQRD
ncbi:MAG: ribosome silencing factor [Lachnospiraceae bacterium]|jgi:ribosome-associated protein